jgi:hypothetical protein
MRPTERLTPYVESHVAEKRARFRALALVAAGWASGAATLRGAARVH